MGFWRDLASIYFAPELCIAIFAPNGYPFIKSVREGIFIMAKSAQMATYGEGHFTAVKSDQLVTLAVAVVAAVVCAWLYTQYTNPSAFIDAYNFDISCGGNTPDYVNGGCV